MASRALISRALARPALLPKSFINCSSINLSNPQFRTKGTSSTSALRYKALHRRISPLPVADAPLEWSAPAAVSSILYETPPPSAAPPKRHILDCAVQDEPGVLSRVSGVLAARGFNIDSLIVCTTQVKGLSRMTIVLSGQNAVVEQARRQLEDVVAVWAVQDFTNHPLVQRELLLAKISIMGPEFFAQYQAHHRELSAADLEEWASMTEEEVLAKRREMQPPKDYHPEILPRSEALRHKHTHLEAITHLAHQFGGKVLDISTESCVVEVSAKPVRIDSFLKLIAPFGVLQSARTGLMALARSPLHEYVEEVEADADDVVDASALPPG